MSANYFPLLRLQIHILSWYNFFIHELVNFINESIKFINKTKQNQKPENWGTWETKN